jgi:hypothetical protein
MRRDDNDFPHDQDGSDGNPSKDAWFTELLDKIMQRTAW